MTRPNRPPRAVDYSGARALIVPDTWATRGACTVTPDTPDPVAAAVFDAFDEPTLGDTPHDRAQRLAWVRSRCASCPVLADCRRFGMTQEFGFYGGLTPEERAARRRGRLATHEQLLDEARRLERAQRVERARSARADPNQLALL